MDVADGLLPKVLPEKEAADEEREAYEEERRLFYVGMTRAKDELEIVTFRKAGLSSSFSQEVFPPKRKPVTTAPRPVLEVKKRDNGRRLPCRGPAFPVYGWYIRPLGRGNWRAGAEMLL